MSAVRASAGHFPRLPKSASPVPAGVAAIRGRRASRPRAPMINLRAGLDAAAGRLAKKGQDGAQALTAARSSRLPRITFSASTTSTTASPNSSARQSLKISAMPPMVSSAMPG